ncbi:hypothetical protein BD413DRAFT_492973 [Trametes elegans]|nr:hypothetical protein BD413DRAFT_492973 [Trametes elegans]
MFSSPSAALAGFGSPSSSHSFSSLAACALAIALLAAPAPAAARFSSISFSDVKQCGSFSVDFAGGHAPSALPLSLNVLPVNGTPVSIQLPSNAWNSTAQIGAAITFLPFPAGTEFVASLDDADGVATAPVSDVLVIDPSDTDDTSCLPTNPAPFVPMYTVASKLEQCEPFYVDYDATSGTTPPSVRGFIPKGDSFSVNQSDASNSTTGPGMAAYTMDAARNSQVLLLFTDQDGHRETSTLLPVFGDVQSSTSCISSSSLANATSLEMTGSSTRVTPKIAVIVIAVCGGVVVLVAAAMVTWYVIHRRKARAERFTKLEEAQSPSAPGPDPEKQSARRHSPPPRIVTSVTTSPISPVESRYADLTSYLRNPPYATMGSTLVTPVSPNAEDPFGEPNTGTLLGPLSARESVSAKRPLGATALGNSTSTVTLPHLRETPSVAYSAAARSSALDPTTTPLPGTDADADAYYTGRLALTPDNSLASSADSPLRRPRSAQTSTSVSTQEIDHILEMATIYGVNDLLPDLPQPAFAAPETIRSSAYMAGRESRRTSGALTYYGSPRRAPGTFSPAHSRNGSQAVGYSPAHSRNGSAQTSSSAHSRTGSLQVLNHSTSQSTLRMNRFREPPLAPLPSSPLASPNARPSFDVDAVAVRASTSGGLTVPRLPQATLARNVSSVTRASVYSVDGEDDGFDGFTMLEPPPRPTQS